MDAETLELYRPTLVSLVVMKWAPGRDGGRSGSTVPREMPPTEKIRRRLSRVPGFPKDARLVGEKDLLVIIRRRGLWRDDDGDRQLTEVGPEYLYSAATVFREKAMELGDTVSKKMTGLQPLGTYLMVAAGAEPNYWFQTKIDMSRMIVSLTRDEKMLDDLSARSKIELLTGVLEGGGSHVGDRLTAVRGSPRLLGFKPASGGSGVSLPENYLLDITFEPRSEQSLSGSLDGKMFEGLVDSVAEGFGRMLAYQCQLRDSASGVYPGQKARALEIRRHIQELQSAINLLLRGELKDSDIRALHGSGGTAMPGQPGRTQEEKLLNLASVYFSQVTEFDASLESVTYDSHDNMTNADRQADILGMSRLMPADLDGESVISLREELKRFANDVHYSYQNLKETVNNSQNSLRNSVEVLKTSLENKQRIINESREWTWNILIIILACFGLMDAITNFMIYYLEHGDAVTAVSYFFISMLPIIGVLLFIGLYMSKRIR